jgi:hypothetical protein
MSAKDPGFDLTPYQTAAKKPGWVTALICAAVFALIGIITVIAGTWAWVFAVAFAGAVVSALIALIAYLIQKR